MPLVEVDEEEFRKSETLRNTVAAWMKNPKSRRKLLEANRAFDPKANIPELDEPDPLDSKLEPVLSELAALKKARADEENERKTEKSLRELNTQIERGFDKLRREEGLMASGETSVRQIMEEKGITDPEIAWAYHQKLHPPQNLVSSSGTGAWNFLEPPSEDQADLKKLIETRGENSGLLDKMTREALMDIRGQGRR